MRLLVIDGNSIANRAFYGIKLLTTKDGRYTNAIFGFLNILLSLLKESEPDEVAVAFDLKAPTFRHKMYDGYKATRHKMPDELAAQLPVIRQLLALLGYREVTAEGWEADDILGTLAAACAEAAAPGTPAVLWVDGADGDALRRVAMAITAKTNAPCCTLGPGGQGLAYALAAAPGGDVRETCKALNAAYQGRGGGKPGFCQGSLAEGSFEQVKAFLLKSLLLREKVAEAPTEAG